MTTVTDSNVHNIAVKGTFDDCQACKNPYIRPSHHIDFRRLGHRKSSFRRPIFQRETSSGRSQLHQLGPNFGTDCLLLPLLFSRTEISSTWYLRRRG